MELEEKMDNLLLLAENIEEKLRRKVEAKENNYQHSIEKKNSHLHLLIETSLLKKIEQEAKEQGISLAEFVRKKLKGNKQLDRIENKVDKLLKRF